MHSVRTIGIASMNLYGTETPIYDKVKAGLSTVEQKIEPLTKHNHLELRRKRLLACHVKQGIKPPGKLRLQQIHECLIERMFRPRLRSGWTPSRMSYLISCSHTVGFQGRSTAIGGMWPGERRGMSRFWNSGYYDQKTLKVIIGKTVIDPVGGRKVSFKRNRDCGFWLCCLRAAGSLQI